METYKIVVVGPGLIGKKHISLLSANKKADLAAIVAPAHEDNIAVSTREVVPHYETLEECFSNHHVDGVIIASPNEFHFQQASKCIKNKIPVLIEKPMTVSLKEAQNLIEIAQNFNKILVGHHRTYSSLLSTAQKIIQSGRLGRLVSIIGSAQFFKPEQYFLDGPWRTQEGGGPVLINMIHEISNMRSLIGEITSVHAFASQSTRQFSVEDTAAINLRFANGALGTFVVSDTVASQKSWEQTAYENPIYARNEKENCYQIFGTKGTLSFPTMKIQYFSDGVEPSWLSNMNEESISTVRTDPLEKQLDHFIAVIEGVENPKVSIHDGYKNMAIISAIQKSIKAKCTVDI